MRCNRCNGMMVYEKFYENCEHFFGWRCIVCGEIIDQVILENRLELLPAKRDSMKDRSCGGKNLHSSLRGLTGEGKESFMEAKDPLLRRFSLVLAVVVVLALTEIGFAQVQKVTGDDGRNQRGVKVEVKGTTATVDAIDYENRMGTLRLSDGTILTFKFGPAVTNSNQLKAGDQVIIRK